jgi:hypothetical protein
MKTYYIYLIPGVKIGCTDKPKVRKRQLKATNFEILEQHNNIYVASDRETELQIQYFGKRDTNVPYYQTVINSANSNGTYEGRSKGGRKAVESGQLASVRDIPKATQASLNSPNCVNKQKWLCPDGKITITANYKKYCIKRGLNIDECKRI